MSASITTRKDRRSQWGSQETADFIAIRAELEMGITHARHIKTLWKTITLKMQQRGYHRSTEQCKCKWKTLVNQYKGKDTYEPDKSWHRPYFEELHAVFINRSKKLHKLLLELEADPKVKKKGKNLDRSSDQFCDDEEDEDDDESEGERRGKSKKRRLDRERKRATAEKCRANNMRAMMECFFQQQQRLELQWREILERREEAYRRRGQEYQDVMASLERESFVREQIWLDKVDERRARDEAHADQRDALFDALVNLIVKGNL